jgi:hypothetical protein
MQKKTFDYIRYINFIKSNKAINLESAFDSGILASGAVINKDVWNEIKFDEQVVACEDKIWSFNTLKRGFDIIPSSATYFYDTSSKSVMSKFKTYYIENLERALFLNNNKIQIKYLKELMLFNWKSFLIKQLQSFVYFLIDSYIFLLTKTSFKKIKDKSTKI